MACPWACRKASLPQCPHGLCFCLGMDRLSLRSSRIPTPAHKPPTGDFGAWFYAWPLEIKCRRYRHTLKWINLWTSKKIFRGYKLEDVCHGKASLIETLGTVQGIRLCEIASLQSLTFLARGKFVWGFKKRYFSVEYNGASVEGRSEHFTISAHIFFTHCHWFWSFSLRSRAVTSSGYHSFYHICNNSAISSRNICKKLYRHYFTRSYSPPKKLMHVSFLII